MLLDVHTYNQKKNWDFFFWELGKKDTICHWEYGQISAIKSPQKIPVNSIN